MLLLLAAAVTSGSPHSSQYCAPSTFSVWHRSQVIMVFRPPRSQLIYGRIVTRNGKASKSFKRRESVNRESSIVNRENRLLSIHDAGRLNDLRLLTLADYRIRDYETVFANVT
jgi:hypothetical protein